MSTKGLTQTKNLVQADIGIDQELCQAHQTQGHLGQGLAAL